MGTNDVLGFIVKTLAFNDTGIQHLGFNIFQWFLLMATTRGRTPRRETDAKMGIVG